MSRIPEPVKIELEKEPSICARQSSKCAGSITWEHAMIYQNRSVQEQWAIIKLCQYHHGLGKWHNNGGGLDKEYNKYLALKRATDEDLDRYPKSGWKQSKKYLMNKYE